MASGVLLVHGLSGKNFSNHVTHDTHHSGTAVIQLNIELAGLLFRVRDVSTEPANTVVSIVLGGRHPSKLHKGEEGKDLEETSGGDGTDSINTGRNIRELQVSRRGKVAIEDNMVVVHDSSNNGSHGNTAVLALNSTTTLKGLWLSIEPSERIEDSKGLGDTELELTDGKSRGSLSN